MLIHITDYLKDQAVLNSWIEWASRTIDSSDKGLQQVLADRQSGICRTTFIPLEPKAVNQSLGTNTRRWDAYLRNLNVNGTLTYPAGTLGYEVHAYSGGAFNPADATTYYIGCLPGTVPSTSTADLRKVWIPRTGTVERIDATFIQAVAGSNETSTVSFRLNNTTDTTISAAVTNDANLTHFVATGLSVAVATGDYFEIKWVTPTWGTNPTTVLTAFQVFIH